MHTESERFLSVFIIIFFLSNVAAEKLKLLMDRILKENLSQKIHSIPCVSVSALRHHRTYFYTQENDFYPL